MAATGAHAAVVGFSLLLMAGITTIRCASRPVCSCSPILTEDYPRQCILTLRRTAQHRADDACACDVADRSELKMTQQEFTGPPLTVALELAAAVVILLYGEICCDTRCVTMLWIGSDESVSVSLAIPVLKE